MDQDLYKIGAASKRTGISPECLRAWERRYGLKPADRAGKTRFYSATQVDRLVTVKALLDQGHPISQIIGLSDAELKSRLSPTARRATHRVRTGLVGGQLILAHRRSREQPPASDGSVDIVAEWASLADFEADRGAVPELDCVVVYLPSLDMDRIESVQDICPNSHVVAAYRYATAADLEACRASARTLVRWPVEWDTLARQITAAAPVPPSTTRRYSDEELLHISLMATDAHCECPRHLAELIGAINDYETHAHRCPGALDGIDDDHRRIEGNVRAARAQLEASLQSLVDKHGLLATSN